jgi:2-hydroxycyclohexanecarboxyl-CoA dehydrogenase
MARTQPQRPQDISHSGVLIVGGTSGIGRAAARAFIDGGAPRLVLVGRDRERGAVVCDDLRARSQAEVHFVAADVTDVEGALLVATEAQRHLHRIDVLINAAAAVHLPTLLHDNPIDSLPGILTDIALPPILMTRAVLTLMRAQNSGCIINVASDAAKVPTPGESIIGAAMAAIVAFSRTAAMEAKRDGVRVNALTPSLVEGTGTAERLFADDFSARLFDKARELAHLGVSTPDDQAALMVYLAGPHGRRITGQAISVNGGISSA